MGVVTVNTIIILNYIKVLPFLSTLRHYVSESDISWTISLLLHFRRSPVWLHFKCCVAPPLSPTQGARTPLCFS